jgi:DNA invertase Pin-like site-specific DNA recombinase
MIYGYARVSTKGQARNGNSLEEQEKLLKQHGAEIIFVERGISGAKESRPEFTKMLETLKEGDTLMVTKFDRFARSLTWASDLISELIDKGITVNVLNFGVLSSDPTSKLMRNILLSFAEYERDMIYERTHEGIEAKRESDPEWKQGRPKKVEIPKEYIEAVASGKMTKAAACRELGISRTTWYNETK